MFNNDIMRAEAVNGFITKVYAWMFFALGTSAATAYTVYSIPMLMYAAYKGLYLLIAAQLGILFYLQAKLLSMSYTRATVLFTLYSVLIGITLSPIFLVYTMYSIVQVFTIAAGMFGIMALYGYFTKKDLSGFGSILFMGLIGLIITQAVNMFFASAQVEYFAAMFGVLLFAALTAYDMQKLKMLAHELNYADDEDQYSLANKLALYGAVILYLDFLNLFLKLLSLMGKKRK